MDRKLTLIVKWLLFIRKNQIPFAKSGKKFKLKKKENNNKQKMLNTKKKWLILKTKEKLNNLMEPQEKEDNSKLPIEIQSWLATHKINNTVL